MINVAVIGYGYAGKHFHAYLSSLASGFKALDLDSNLIAQFVPVILSFVQSKGGDVAKSILERVLK